ncbi:MAG: hypothetical protein BRD23_06605 [Halobacteriales archaeon SW_9_67_25]|nr:MAG: hypothetical protein BRD23_06605 [Halobacteriales archaeon SW_9_67_25]
MADLNDRGQIILIAGVVLAVTFLALAVVVNSAIFTGNLATRGETTGASDALTYRHEVADGSEALAVEINEQNTSGLVDNAEDSLGNVSAQGGTQNARRGRVVTVDINRPGTVVEARAQNNATSDPTNFTNASGETDWDLVTEANRTVEGEFQVEGGLATSEGDALHIFINESGGSQFWRLAVYESPVSGVTNNITVRDDTGLVSTCEDLGGTPFTINLTAGVVTNNPGTVCDSELDDNKRTYTAYNSKNVSFGNADRINGTYNVTVEANGSTPGVDENDFDGSSPTVTVRIDVLDIEYVYESQRLQYETDITIRPGEDDD